MPSAENNAQLASALVALRQAVDTPPHPAQPVLPRWSIGKKVGSDFHHLPSGDALPCCNSHTCQSQCAHTQTHTHANLILQRVHHYKEMNEHIRDHRCTWWRMSMDVLPCVQLPRYSSQEIKTHEVPHPAQPVLPQLQSKFAKAVSASCRVCCVILCLYSTRHFVKYMCTVNVQIFTVCIACSSVTLCYYLFSLASFLLRVERMYW